MAIIISKATEKEASVVSEKSWREIDIEHYGEPVEWNIEEFYFIATEDGKIVGKIEGKCEAGVVFINSVIVVKNKRGIGIGKKLVEAVETFGKRLKAHKIFLFTMEQWDASNFYEGLGYIQSGILPKHYLKRDFVIYSKML